MASISQFMLVAFCGALFTVNCLALNLGGASIKKIDRKIDLSTQVVKITSKITLEASGSASTKTYFHCLDEEMKENWSFFAVKSGGKQLSQDVHRIEQQKDGITCYAYNLPSTLSGSSIIIDVELILTHILVPFPKSIKQGEKQYMVHNGNHYYLTPYTVATQTTTVNLFSPNVLSYSRLKPSAHSDTSISYGPYENIAPFSVDPMRIHCENHAPFLTVTSLHRLIEISHWGNIAVEETLEILHTGALLKGPFSRYDYQREHNSYSTIKDFKTVLPAAAKDVYYRDEIGNISTSNMRVMEESVELDIRPRFPLFGGWKTKYTIGYNVPSYEHLFYSGSQYALKMRFLDHAFDDMVVDDLTVKIILPEGVNSVDFRPPYEVDRKEDSVHYTYLDVFGRKVISASKKNLVENHILDFELHYTFPSILMLFEPLLVFAAFLILFITVMIYVRLDFTICKDDSTEAKMRISSYCEMVHNSHDNRAALYEKLEDEMQKLKTNKDVGHSQISTKKIFNAVKDETQTITQLAAKIKNDHQEYAERVNELQKNDRQLVELLQQQLQMVEKLVSGKLNKQNFVENDAVIQKKKESLLEKIKVCLNSI